MLFGEGAMKRDKITRVGDDINLRLLAWLKDDIVKIVELIRSMLINSNYACFFINEKKDIDIRLIFLVKCLIDYELPISKPDDICGYCRYNFNCSYFKRN